MISPGFCLEKMNKYAILKNQCFQQGDFKIVPIRMEDRHEIMKWRNEQIFHLRQNQLLTKEVQDKYFTDVVASLFEQEQPSQVLFSYLKNDICIGYGGLVHINWTDKHAEISFIMDTTLQNEHFEFHWSTYLGLIEQVAFDELSFHKIFTYAFDLRPRLYAALLERKFHKEAQLKEHAFFEGRFIDVIIHAKLNRKVLLRKAGIEDLEATYVWANDPTVRAFAYNQKQISKDDHLRWFKDKIQSDQCAYFILESNFKSIGSIRFDIEENQATAKISYLVDPNFVGQGYGTYLLENGVNQLVAIKPHMKSVYGFVWKENLASCNIFKKLGYEKTMESDSEFKFEKILQ